MHRSPVINQAAYDEARTINPYVRVIKERKITLPGHMRHFDSGRWGDDKDLVDEEALKYASDTIMDFTRFVFHVTRGTEDITAPFTASPFLTRSQLIEELKLWFVSTPL